MDFWRAAAVLGKRKWLILFSVVVTVVFTYAATRLVGTQWQATVQLASSLPGPLMPGGAATRDPGKQAATIQAALYTSYLRSGDVLQPVFQQLHIQPNGDMLNNIQIEATGLNLYQLEVSDRNPDRAARLANALSTQFVKEIAAKQITGKDNNIATLKKQLHDINQQLMTAQNQLNAYRVKHKINIDLKNSEGLALNQLTLTERNRDAAEEKLKSAQARLTQAKSEMAQLAPTVSVSAPTSSDPILRGLQGQLSDLENRLALAKAKYTDSDPRVKELLNEIAQTKDSIKQHQQTNPELTSQQNPQYASKMQQVQQLQEEVASNQAILGTLQNQVQNARNLVDSYAGVDTPLTQLQGNVNALNATRAKLENALNAAQMSTSSQGPLKILSQVNNFNPPVNTTMGRTVKLIILGALCALIGCSALVIAFESIDRRLRSVKEAEIILPTRVLAAIPQPMGDVSYASLARATELYPLSLHSEAYRFLGQHLLNAHRRMRSYMVLSAKAEQGSTSTVTNLGITLAQAGQRVIIVDANVRTPEIHQVFGLANDFGFMDLLQKPDAAAFEQALHATNVANLQVITSGTAPENPWQSFRSQNLVDVAHRLRDMADYVLYDTPSALLFTDAMNLAPVVDAAFLCVRALEPPTGAERRLVELLEQANVPVLGSVLTDVPASVLEGYNNYQHYYAPTVNTVPLVANDVEGGVSIATAVATRIEDPKNGHGHDGNGNNGNLIP